jgi:hypothetical protein
LIVPPKSFDCDIFAEATSNSNGAVDWGIDREAVERYNTEAHNSGLARMSWKRIDLTSSKRSAQAILEKN